MKYGETLRQRSIPAWGHHNIDYDDIKHLIKEQTTPGNGKSVSVPGRGDDKLIQFEDSLFAILADQHHRIDLFVKSKAGEIQRRLDHSRRQLKQLSSRSISTADRRIPVSRLERYGRLENDVVKAGDEIKSLARFTSTQRTAFRKLLKKYKKWTGSAQLEDRFRTEILDDPKSFTNFDLGPLLDDYSATLQQIRHIYETKIQQKHSSEVQPESEAAVGSHTIAKLRAAIASASKVDFDTAIATIPLAEGGTFASYFIHPENVVELQVLLLQHASYFQTRSRSNSVTSPISASPTRDTFAQAMPDGTDYYALEADNPERLTKELSSLTIDEREHRPGAAPQKAKLCARWNNDDDVRIYSTLRGGKGNSVTVKRKHIDSFFDKTADYLPKKGGVKDVSENVLALRRDFEKASDVQPLYKFFSCRSRFVGTNNSHKAMTMATLDTHIGIQKSGRDAGNSEASTFPFAVLLVRVEGSSSDTLISALDASHLVERVRGFSFEYHGIWETCASTSNIPPPFWIPILSRDIRKLPPPAMKRSGSTADGGSGSRSANSRGSLQGVTDSATAVETAHSDSVTFQEDLEAPPLRSFRKKRRRAYPSQQPAEQPEPQQKYWSEYDHPEDGSDAGDAYVLYIDPNEKSTLDRLFDRLGGLFYGRRAFEHEALLTQPSSPKDDGTDSDEEAAAAGAVPRQRMKSYGTLPTSADSALAGHYAQETHALMPHAAWTCFVASLIILVVAFFLATTGRHKFAYQVNAGVVFAIASSLIFAIVGFATLLRRADIAWPAWVIGIAVLVIDAVGSGGLLAWMLG